MPRHLCKSTENLNGSETIFSQWCCPLLSSLSHGGCLSENSLHHSNTHISMQLLSTCRQNEAVSTLGFNKCLPCSRPARKKARFLMKSQQTNTTRRSRSSLVNGTSFSVTSCLPHVRNLAVGIWQR